MEKFTDLEHIDSSFRSIKINQDQKITGICDRFSFSESKIYFCGTKKFWQSFVDSKISGLYIIFDKAFYEEASLAMDNLDMLAGYATVDSIPLAISRISKVFCEISESKFNDEVDARKTGTCVIDPSAIISENVFIGANVRIGANVKVHSGCIIQSFSEIGDGSELYGSVVLYPQTKIGKNCRIHGNVTIGSDGFGYNYHNGEHLKVWHFGGVIIKDNVEIGSNTSIDQGTFSPTVIGEGTKIDNQVHIAHNVRIGRGVLLCGQVGLSGSVEIGDFCVFGGQSGVAPDVVIGKGCQIGGSAGVLASLSDGATVAGFPARPIKDWLKGLAFVRKSSLKK